MPRDASGSEPTTCPPRWNELGGYLLRGALYPEKERGKGSTLCPKLSTLISTYFRCRLKSPIRLFVFIPTGWALTTRETFTRPAAKLNFFQAVQFHVKFFFELALTSIYGALCLRLAPWATFFRRAASEARARLILKLIS